MDTKSTGGGLSHCNLDRRSFLKLSMTLACGLLVPFPVRAAINTSSSAARSISLRNTHTGESLEKVTYFAEGQYLPEALREIDVLLRDHRNGEIRTIDPKLYDQLFELGRAMDHAGPFEIISGYRSPASNSELRNQSRGVAKRSFHLTGQAVDIRLPGVQLAQLRSAAIAHRAGGVGFYPSSGFVHIDTGPFRTW